MSARVRFALAACVLLPATPAHAGAVPSDHGCMGPWVGEGQNTGFDTSWTIELTMTGAPEGGRCGTIEYTNPACGGTLEDCTLRGDEIHTRERYTHNDGRCAPAGRVIIRCEGDTMRYSWIGWERVNSVLHRPEGYRPPAPTGGGGPPDPTNRPTASGKDDPPTTTPPSAGQPTPGPAPQPPPTPPAVPDAPRADDGGCGACAVGASTPTEGGGSAPGWLAVALCALAVTRARGRRRRRQGMLAPAPPSHTLPEHSGGALASASSARISSSDREQS